MQGHPTRAPRNWGLGDQAIILVLFVAIFEFRQIKSERFGAGKNESNPTPLIEAASRGFLCEVRSNEVGPSHQNFHHGERVRLYRTNGIDSGSSSEASI